jgi:uncharacterized protein YcbK (DUF882 family)
MKFLPENRSTLRITAMLAVGSLLLTPLPARAQTDEEILSLVLPRAGEMTGAIPGEGSLPFSPEDDLFESTPDETGSEKPSIKVNMERVDSQQALSIDLPLDGVLSPEDAAVVAHFFRCRRTGKQRPMDAGVLALLADVAAHWADKRIEIISGFRAPPYGAPHSKHFKGLAIDLRIPGVRTTTLRDYVWRKDRGVGVGYYKKENFVHIDSRPDAQDRAWSGSEEGGPEELNPRWARKARRHMPTHMTAPDRSAPYALAPVLDGRTL